MVSAVILCASCRQLHHKSMYRVGQNRTVFLKFLIPVYVDIQWCSIYQTVQFFICSKSAILHVTAFKYSLHNFSVTTLW